MFKWTAMADRPIKSAPNTFSSLHFWPGFWNWAAVFDGPSIKAICEHPMILLMSLMFTQNERNREIKSECKHWWFMASWKLWCKYWPFIDKKTKCWQPSINLIHTYDPIEIRKIAEFRNNWGINNFSNKYPPYYLLLEEIFRPKIGYYFNQKIFTQKVVQTLYYPKCRQLYAILFLFLCNTWDCGKCSAIDTNIHKYEPSPNLDEQLKYTHMD